MYDAKGYLVVCIKTLNIVLFLSCHFIAAIKEPVRAADKRKSSCLSNLKMFIRRVSCFTAVN